ncbi:hypothetical protein BCV69DRAFT_281040 [Microstroma glucosiphilum]|uniref:Myb-like domain-containing protein n=1 Tax=Pseudomicrostroma glucosiphilum TaxID=1684307 RepID=A0A316UHL1_9BASI|nr:hypothetical protein BCV69DRAFT_281040 [Pseudomicrostroma glucosiphilum]PWN23423.1 hypothetical protein BCV69DRAFT_281040 [Pseudomicrostroma glucosiphilum]
MPPKRKREQSEDGVPESERGTDKGKGSRKKPKPFTREEDLIIIDYLDSLKKFADLARLFPDRVPFSVRQRVVLIFAKMRGLAGGW